MAIGMNEKDKLRVRDLVVNSMRKFLVGPADGELEVVGDGLNNKYLCGMLFPQNMSRENINQGDDDEQSGETDGQNEVDFNLSDAYETLPSSMGVSFFLSEANEISINAYAARYIPSPKDCDENKWKRSPYATTTQPESVTVDLTKIRDGSTKKIAIFGGNAELQCFVRSLYGGRLVTISLLNNKYTKKSVYDSEAISMYLFQCGFEVQLRSSLIDAYPSASSGERHLEDEEIELIYRNKKTYGIGHGCSATWEIGDDGFVKKITAEILPCVEVPSLTTKIHGLSDRARQAQDLKILSDEKLDRHELRALLNEFVDQYVIWHEDQKYIEKSLNSKASKSIIKKQNIAIERMRTGIKFLTSSDNADYFRAFKLAQLAMLKQFSWNDAAGRGPFDVGRGVYPPETHSEIPENKYVWRPFQLAFQLVSIESIANTNSTYRDVVDLLWFPTGGGKTEAYLALTAFEIIKRRILMRENGGGTSVWMRYTLRLLTSQQFERCSTLISVLECMRKDDVTLLGYEPISLGLWVGGTTTPNRLAAAGEQTSSARDLYLEVLEEKKPENKFQLNKCPRCGTRIIPETKSGNEKHYGVFVSDSEFKLFCPDESCKLHERIPVSIVDDDLYRRPPTMLLGTIDKFARTLHDLNSSVFFGLDPITVNGKNIEVIPPSLIIQDELHLIDGPLGTISGMYEAGFDTVIKQNGGSVKYIAATATILRADEQIAALYGRDASIFPPTGLSVEDSFFSKEDTENIGRTYLGVMNSGLYKATTTLVQASAAGLQMVMQLQEQLKDHDCLDTILDSYWTQVIYHNSRQELGKTTTLLRDDVDTRIKILQSNRDSQRVIKSIRELSANLKGAEVGQALDAVGKEYGAEEAIDVLPCTNMLSVGVDIPRLGQMIVKGQPKSTSEYIQATSRVGRDSKRPPGIVITLYSSTRPRDRSHYETFRSYHQALYRNVEPSSVTPFSSRALDRTLHAAYVFVIRSLMGWKRSEDAQSFDASNTDIIKFTDQFKKRLRNATRRSSELDYKNVVTRLDTLIKVWDDAAKTHNHLKFMNQGQFNGLLTNKTDFTLYPELPWPILNSMRHVDGETNISIKGSG